MAINDPRLAKFLDSFGKDEPGELIPEFSTKSESFSRYPAFESALELDTRHANRLLEDLVRAGVLERRFHDKMLFCPVCNSRDLRLVHVCPKCGSSHVLPVTVFEHVACGELAPEAAFRNGASYICPKCRGELRLVGSDYRMPGVHFQCRDCSELTATPGERWRCRNCSEQLGRDDLREVPLYSYRRATAAAAPKPEPEFAAPRAQVAEYLNRQGYRVEARVDVAGRSGAVHEIDLLATKSSAGFEHRIVVGFAGTGNGSDVDSEEVIKLYAKAYDVNAQDIVMVAMPRLSADARQFAGHYRIKILDGEDLTHIPEKLQV
jgi:hypothetical protein